MNTLPIESNRQFAIAFPEYVAQLTLVDVGLPLHSNYCTAQPLPRAVEFSLGHAFPPSPEDATARQGGVRTPRTPQSVREEPKLDVERQDKARLVGGVRTDPSLKEM